MAAMDGATRNAGQRQGRLGAVGIKQLRWHATSLRRIPGLRVVEPAEQDICCGSAGIYNVVHNDMSMALLEKKMEHVNSTGAEVICSANPGCLLQLRAGAKFHGNNQRVMHVMEVLDEAYR